MNNKNSYNIIKFFKKNKLLFASFIFFFLLATWIRIFAISSPYSPGATLDPACTPGSTYCTVTPTSIGGTINSATSGSVLFASSSGALAQDNSNFSYSATTTTLTVKKLTVSGSSTTSLSAPTGLSASQFNDPNSIYPALAYNHNYRVYAYKTISNVSSARIYSSSYATLSSNFTDDNSGNQYSVHVSWTAVSGADGYRILKYDDAFPYNFDAGYDTTDTSFYDDGCYNLCFDNTDASKLIVNSASSYPLIGNVAGSFDVSGALSAGNIVLGNNILSGDSSSNLSFGYSSGTGGNNNIYFGQNAGSGISGASNNILFGQNAGYSSSGASSSIFFGQNSGYTATYAFSSIFFGQDSGNGATNSNNSIFFGNNAGINATSAHHSVFFGLSAGDGATGANNSVFFGQSAGVSSTSGYYSNFFGYQSGYNASSAHDSNFFGYQSGKSATNAANSNFFGSSAGRSATNANASNFFGSSSGYLATNASNSNFFGDNAGQSATNASDSNFFGHNAGISGSSASYSNFFGYQSGMNATNAANSNFFGYQAGYSATNAKRSIFIGYNTGNTDTVNNTSSGTSILIGDYAMTGGYQNSIAIGHGTQNSTSTQANIGNVLFANGIYNSDTATSTAVTTGKLGIAVNTPSYTLQAGNSSVSGIVARFQNSTGTCDINPTTTSLSCSSDQNLKKNIVSLSDGFLVKVDALRPVTYNWNGEYDGAVAHSGFIAQEVRNVFPDLVSADSDTGLLSLNYIGFIPYLAKSVQELDLKITGIANFENDSTFADRLRAWFADVTNGIQKLFVHEVHTDKLCVGTVCVTESQFLDMVNQNNISPNIENPQPNPDPIIPDENPPQNGTPIPENNNVIPDPNTPVPSPENP